MKHNLIHQNQYGFRKNVSTTHAILDIVNKITCNNNRRKFTGLIFLDLKKAFDTVTHKILIKELAHFGISGNTNNLFQCYLSSRKQYVDINGSKSTSKLVQFGVSQGSNLGPILFSIYVNDIFNNFNIAPVLFADDPCLFVEVSFYRQIELSSAEVEKAKIWPNSNKLQSMLTNQTF